jgi:hypothetical protein
MVGPNETVVASAALEAGRSAKCLAPTGTGGYPRHMEISPNWGNFPRFRVQVSDTLKPHGRPFPGTPDCHQGAGCRQRRATGDSVSLPPFQYGLFSRVQLAFPVMVFAAPVAAARRVPVAWS